MSQVYTQVQWEVLLASSIEQIQQLSKLKGGEYAGDLDRLANFRRNAASLGLLPEQVWAVYTGKHWDAIQQYCLDLGKGTSRVRSESISGRLDDLIVYCLLMKAMVEEREVVKPRLLTHQPVIVPEDWDEVFKDVPATIVIRPPSTESEKVTNPDCPKTGGPHAWARENRHSDICAACGTGRPHQIRPR